LEKRFKEHKHKINTNKTLFTILLPQSINLIRFIISNLINIAINLKISINTYRDAPFNRLNFRISSIDYSMGSRLNNKITKYNLSNFTLTGLLLVYMHM
jgi:hypothetical protein